MLSLLADGSADWPLQKAAAEPMLLLLLLLVSCRNSQQALAAGDSPPGSMQLAKWEGVVGGSAGGDGLPLTRRPSGCRAAGQSFSCPCRPAQK